MEIVADRFAILGDGRAIDLATGEETELRRSSVGDEQEHARWILRCDRLARLHHHAIAPLVDYGLCGKEHRFEAWGCRSWNGPPRLCREVLRFAGSFLHASGLSEGALTPVCVHQHQGRLLVVPDAAAGYDRDRTPSEAVERVEACGLVTIDRRAVAALADVLAECGSVPRVVALWGPDGAGKATAIGELARVARLHGFVPVSVERVRDELVQTLSGRSLFLISRTDTRVGWRGFVERSLGHSHPHVLLIAGCKEPSHVDGIGLDRISPDTLVASVCPDVIAPKVLARLTAAAERADGWPGRFARLVWPANHESGDKPRPVSVAAEEPSRYGLDSSPSESAPRAAWPAPDEIDGLKRRLETATHQVSSGRHAPGERALRQLSRSLARRRDWSLAAQGELTLGMSLLKRGRPREARVVLAEARCHAASVGDDRRAFEAAVLMGAAWMDSGELDHSSSALHAAVAAGRALGEPGSQATARLALARCLFWRGQYHDAGEVLGAVDTSALTPDLATRMLVSRSRIALGQGELAGAATLASAALDAAEHLGDGTAVAASACALALVQLVVGDRGGVERHTALAIRAARAARDPLRALKARLLMAECARRQGRAQPASALLARIRALRSFDLPCTIRARSALLGDLLKARSTGDVIEQHVARSGLTALMLFAPSTVAGLSSQTAAADDVLDILQICQTATEDREALTAVCAHLRVRLRASTVAVLARAEGRIVTLAADGGRHGTAMASRVYAAGQMLPPHRVEDGIEGGAPIRYGGEVVGVLTGRWTLGSPPDTARVSMALLTGATALCPAAAAVLAERTARTVADAHELLGISDPMADLRRSVERAATAPFPVLIDGESGAGKELVARALHRRSHRRDRPLTALNCAALPDDLAESELFGHARGAFTGAVNERPGVFEQAHAGTLFLDEIGELSMRAQAKILRAIQEGEVRRVGENVSRRVDVRLIAATNRDLRQEVDAGRFRLDLLYRLDVIRLRVPPLRSRREDIALLVEHFWREAASRVGTRATLASSTVALLSGYGWPGNVRELQNVLAALAVRAPKRGVVPPTALPPPIGTTASLESWRLDAARRGFEERFVRAALVRTAGHRGRAAEELGITRQGLTKLMARLGIVERTP